MSSIESRIKKLEEENPPEVKQFFCCYYEDNENQGKPYQVTPWNDPKAPPLEFATLNELRAFGKRPGVDLVCVVIKYANAAELAAGDKSS